MPRPRPLPPRRHRPTDPSPTDTASTGTSPTGTASTAAGAPAADEREGGPHARIAGCKGVYAKRTMEPPRSFQPEAGGVRMFAMQFKQEVRHVRTYASFRRAINCALKRWVLPFRSKTIAREDVVLVPAELRVADRRQQEGDRPGHGDRDRGEHAASRLSRPAPSRPRTPSGRGK